MYTDNQRMTINSHNRLLNISAIFLSMAFHYP